MNSYLDSKGVEHLWKKLSLEDYPNNETLIAVLNAIDETKVDKEQLKNYLTKEEYVAGESGGSIDLSIYTTENEVKALLQSYVLKSEYNPQSILETVYPIGAIYLSVNDINPNILFGFGSWEQIKDTFLLAAGDTYSAGSTGGEEKHTLTVEEMPVHTHDFNRHQLWRNETIPTSGESDGYGASNKTLTVYRDTTTSTGSGQPHNNMPPYLSVYMWKRIN